MDQKKVLMLIAQRDFRDEEYEIPKEIFEQVGFKVVTASEQRGEARGKLDGLAKVDISFMEVNVHDYDALVFVGGSGMEHYFYDEELLSNAREGFEQNKLIGAICIAPTVLANAGILDGKRVTATESQREILVQKGAQFTGVSVEVDGNIVTANGPDAAREFAEKIVRLLAGN